MNYGIHLKACWREYWKPRHSLALLIVFFLSFRSLTLRTLIHALTCRERIYYRINSQTQVQKVWQTRTLTICHKLSQFLANVCQWQIWLFLTKIALCFYSIKTVAVIYFGINNDLLEDSPHFCCRSVKLLNLLDPWWTLAFVVVGTVQSIFVGNLWPFLRLSLHPLINRLIYVSVTCHTIQEVRFICVYRKIF